MIVIQEWEMSPEQIRDKIDKMTWSFSRVNAASGCMYCFYLQYIEELESMPNAYAQFGTICHETLEKYLKGELNMFNVSEYYQEHYSDYVTCDFPSNKYVDLAEKTYNQGLEYFNSINFNFDKYEILGVEQELKFKVGKYNFKGYADAICRDRDTNEIILLDHKTSSFKYLKNGEVSKTNAQHYQDFRRQEYLYCIPLIEKYGKVDYLSWNMLRDQREIKIPFDEKEYKETIDWCIKTIENIEQEMLWLPDTSDSYWCSTICNHRDKCIYRQGGYSE